MKHLNRQLFILTLAFASTANAQNADFEATVSEILANNPTLAARRASANADMSALKADNNLADPEVEFEHQWGQPHVGNKWSVSVSQSFDWPGVYSSLSKAASAGAKASDLLFLADLADMRLRVSQTLADYIAANLQLQLSETVSENLALIAAKVESAFNHGESTILDYRKICFEKAEATATTDAAAALVVSLREELYSLNGGKTIDLNKLISFPEFQLRTEDYYLERQLAEDPNILACKYLGESALHSVKAASRNNLPGFSIGYIHNVEIGDHFNGLKLGVTLPFFANRHRKAEAKARLQSAESELLASQLDVNRRVIADFTKAALLDSRLEQYKNLFPESGDDYLNLLRKSFNGGQMSLIIYLYEINYYTEARTAYINLLHDLTLTMLSLDRTYSR